MESISSYTYVEQLRPHPPSAKSPEKFNPKYKRLKRIFDFVCK